MNYDVISHISQIETRNFAEKRGKTLEKSTTHQSQRRNLSFYRQLHEPRACPLKVTHSLAEAIILYYWHVRELGKSTMEHFIIAYGYKLLYI